MENDEQQVACSIEEMFDRYGNMVFRVLLQHMHNEADAQDVLQNVFIKIMKGWPSFENIHKEKAWVLRVAMNTCKDHWKYERIRKHEDLNDQYETNTKPQVEFEILPYVMNLPQKYRDVIYLYYYEEYNVREIADILQMKEATVLTWLRRARLKLKDVLKGSDWHEEI